MIRFHSKACEILLSTGKGFEHLRVVPLFYFQDGIAMQNLCTTPIEFYLGRSDSPLFYYHAHVRSNQYASASNVHTCVSDVQMRLHTIDN